MNSNIYEKLTDKQITSIMNSSHGIILVNGKKYYYKECGRTEIDNTKIDVTGIEILMELLALEVDINSAHYELLCIGNKRYTLSEEINSKFVNARNMGMDFHSLSSIIHELEKNKNEDISKIIPLIVKIYLFDILFLNGDRSSTNWGMVGGRNVYILDNQFCFDSSYPPQITFHPDYDYYKDKNPFMAMYGDSSNASTEDTYLEELSYFMNGTSQEYYDLFLVMFSKLTPDLMEEKILKVEKMCGMKLPDLYILLDIYKKHYDNIRKLLENKKKRK